MLTKRRVVLDTQGPDDEGTVVFSNVDALIEDAEGGEVDVNDALVIALNIDVWIELVRPDQITVTIEPGNILEEEVRVVELPHSRACGIRKHEHGVACHRNCPSCQGRVVRKEMSA